MVKTGLTRDYTLAQGSEGQYLRYDLIHFMGSFDRLPVYTVTKQQAIHGGPLDSDTLRDWVYGLQENYPCLEKEDIKTYVIQALGVSSLSDYDTIID